MATETKSQSVKTPTSPAAPPPPPTDSGPPGHKFEASDTCSTAPLEQLLEGRTHAEVGALLGISQSTVRKRLGIGELSKECHIACNAILEAQKPPAPEKMVCIATLTEEQADTAQKLFKAMDLPPIVPIRVGGE